MSTFKNKKEARDCLMYVKSAIRRMTPGNLAHQKSAIHHSVIDLEKYLKGGK